MCDELAHKMRLSLNEEVDFLRTYADTIEDIVKESGDCIDVERLYRTIDILKRSIDRVCNGVDDLNRYHKELEKNANDVEQWYVFGGGQLTIAEKSLLRDGILSDVDGLRKVICITDPGEYTSNGLIAYEDGDGHWYYGVVNWDKDCRGCSSNGLELLNSE
jgi:hypothetical protein